MPERQQFDVIIIGGSYAGLAAGMTLGRSLRKVLIIDEGKPCNWQTPHSHGFITQDGATPAAIATKAKEQMLQYPTIQFLNGKAVKANRENNTFFVSTERGEQFESSKLLLATGVRDLMPPIPGFAECWGISVLHCPYCHGYEVRGKKTGIIGNGDAGFELVKLISHWSKELILFTNGKSTLNASQRSKLEQYNIPVVEEEIEEFVHQNGYISQVLVSNGQQFPITALYARVPFVQHGDFGGQLGAEHTEAGHLKADELGKTNIPGLFAAGDNTTPLRAVSVASAAGHKTAAGINKVLLDESF